MSRRPPSSDGIEKGLLGRWSERKRHAREARDTDVTEPEDDNQTGGTSRDEAASRERIDNEHPLREQTSAEDVKTDADMPDLDSIDEHTDMSDFFSPGVSEQLRNQALRRLWRLSKFNVVDPLDDYNEDFRTFELLGDMVTSDMRHRTEMEETPRQASGTAEELASSEQMGTTAHVEDNGEHDEQEGEQRVAETRGSDDTEPDGTKAASQTPSKAEG